MTRGEFVEQVVKRYGRAITENEMCLTRLEEEVRGIVTIYQSWGGDLNLFYDRVRKVMDTVIKANHALLNAADIIIHDIHPAPNFPASPILALAEIEGTQESKELTIWNKKIEELMMVDLPCTGACDNYGEEEVAAFPRFYNKWVQLSTIYESSAKTLLDEKLGK